MLLGDWMRSEGLTDQAVADMIGDISEFGVRKLRWRQRGPSIRVAVAIETISSGKVRPTDLVPLSKVREANAAAPQSGVLPA